MHVNLDTCRELFLLVLTPLRFEVNTFSYGEKSQSRRQMRKMINTANTRIKKTATRTKFLIVSRGVDGDVQVKDDDDEDGDADVYDEDDDNDDGNDGNVNDIDGCKENGDDNDGIESSSYGDEGDDCREAVCQS